MALFDHRGKLREKGSIGLASGHARELGAKREVRLAARRDLREKR